ncbi:MAG: aldehyde dehydrogenase family protein, partial [Rhodospirillaceae bacterium]|nr:aldehyde dehydrogenase family protein [Rhodospirillaceae bacterium]
MSELTTFQNLVNGKRIDSVSREWFDSFNPFTGKAWSRIPTCGAADVDFAVESAHAAFTSSEWSSLTPTARGQLMVRLADLISENAERLAEIEVRDNGKLIAEMSAQLNYIPQWYRYFGGLADKVEGRVLPIDKPDMFAYTRQEPLGVIAMVTPWNSPLLLLAWKLAPAL